MKKLIVIACAFLALSATASAQFMNSASGKSSGKAYASSQNIEKTFGTISLTYSPVNMKAKYRGEEIDVFGESGIDNFNALSLVWTNAHNILPSQPLYVEYGAGLQWAFGFGSQSDDDDYSAKYSVNFLSIKVPVSIVYDFTVPNTSFSIAPYAGLDLSGYLLGQEKVSWENYGEYSDETSGSEKMSFFSKDDMDDSAFNRFILGWHIGARFSLGKYFLGVAYEGPITNFLKENGVKINSNQVNISLGFKF